MNVSFKTFLPAIAGGLLTLTACEDANIRAERYMADKPYTEYEEVTKNNSETLVQSKLDSVAYRDIFESTKAAKDSALVAEFNQIAASIRGYNNTEGPSSKFRKIYESAAKQGMTTEKMQKLKSISNAPKAQHCADDWAYRKFFEKAGIMNDSIAKKCDEVSKKIRP